MSVRRAEKQAIAKCFHLSSRRRASRTIYPTTNPTTENINGDLNKTMRAGINRIAPKVITDFVESSKQIKRNKIKQVAAVIDI
jgi:hypothetical protein